MLRVATGISLRPSPEGSQKVDRFSLIDLIAAAFLDEVDGLVREGLARAYRSHEANGTTFRGRLLVGENTRCNIARADRFYVRFATFDADIPLNQALGEAVRTLVDLQIADGLRVRATRHSLNFEELTRVRMTVPMLDRIALSRSTVRYEKALQLARLILEGVAPALTYGRTSVVAFLFDMNRLWERFVATLFRRSTVPGISVRTQETVSFWAGATAARRIVKPDIVIRDKNTGEALLIVDTKWKVNDGSIPSDDELKQMFVYNELLNCRDAVLLYPASTTAPLNVRGTFDVTKGHVCRTACLGLFQQDRLSVSGMQAEVNELLSHWAAPAMVTPGC